MIGGKHGWLGWMVCVALAVWLGFADPAAGTQPVTGEGLIVEKNVEQDVTKGRITLDTGVVLEVTARTKITSAQGKRLTLLELPVAQAAGAGGGIIAASGDAMVRYQGMVRGGRLSAYVIQVMGQIPH